MYRVGGGGVGMYELCPDSDCVLLVCGFVGYAHVRTVVLAVLIDRDMRQDGRTCNWFGLRTTDTHCFPVRVLGQRKSSTYRPSGTLYKIQGGGHFGLCRDQMTCSVDGLVVGHCT